MEYHGGGSQLSANSATRGGRGNNSNNRGEGCGGRGGSGRSQKGGRGGGRSSSFLQDVFCQLCQNEGHTVVRCFKRFNSSYSGPAQKSASAISSYGVDTNWYADSGATDHITGDLEKLTIRDKYHEDCLCRSKYFAFPK
jgi:hypothetical protein